ncbi:MAG TPA: lipoprotein-releasing ABC transporter permease subunit [Rhodanobacteraceae bacterium]|nr:lipoprotein-releasing ABC transporter permease subunit [Rhodanobacteraceae bacterium]
MFRPLELCIGLRYTRAKRRNHFISFISLVSMLGIAVGITALITVISVMNGFDSELRSRMLGMLADATISSYADSMPSWQEALDRARADPQVKAAAPYVERYVMIQGRGDEPAGALVRGIDPVLEAQVSDLPATMKQGSIASLKPGSWNIVLGRDLALQLGVGVGDKVVVYAASFSTTPVGIVPKLRRFTVSGIFQANMQEYDSGLVVTSMADIEKLYRMDGPSGVRLKLADKGDAWQVARRLADQLGPGFHVRTWMQSNVNLLGALEMEKKVMFLILSLIIAVAAFNLVSTLVMLVTDKQADIAILRTLGATPASVMGVFMVQGLVVGLIGIALGVLFGSVLSINVPDIVKWIEHVFHVQFLSPDVYYISEVPSELHWSDVGWITGLAAVFCLLATLYPAWRAARTQPAQALRYE